MNDENRLAIGGWICAPPISILSIKLYSVFCYSPPLLLFSKAWAIAYAGSHFFRHTFLRLREYTKSILVLLAAILLTRLHSYLLFHLLAELTSIVIGVCVFTIAWNSASLLESSFLLILGIGSVYVSVVDMLHALAFKGMGIFQGDDANFSTQLWLSARYLQAIAFLAAPLFLHRRVRRQLPLVVFGALATALLASMFVWSVFPRAYIEGTGLTLFKIGSEYAIIAILFAAMALLWRNRAALAFTLYFGVTDTANLVGHLLKIAAFYLLYRALVEIVFSRPYDLLLRQLKQSEQTERTGRNLAEAELQSCGESYLGLMNNALVGVFHTSLEGTVLLANSELARLVEILKRERYAREFETDLWTKDGQARHMLMSASLKDETISGMILDITERKRAEEKIKTQVDQLAALRSIDIAIISSADLHLTLKIVLEQVTRQLRVDAASVLLLNPHQHTLEYAEGLGFRKKITTLPPLRLGEGFAGRAALECRIVSAVNIAESEIEFRQKRLIEGEDFVSVYTVPLIIKGQVRGVLDIFHREELRPDQAWLDFLETLAKQTAIAIDNATLFEGLQRSNIDLVLAYDTTLEGWSRAMDLRDKETEGHTARVTEMTIRLARAAGMSEEEIVHVRRGALLHDIGKMGIPDAILLKPDKLTDAEWVEMRKHTQYAYEMLAPIAYLKPALDIPYCHHEKWDGTGYPRGLKGEQIPLAARLFSVVDVWDALRSDRPYRKGWSDERVYEYIKSLSGTHFDPKAVELFFEVISEDRREAN